MPVTQVTGASWTRKHDLPGSPLFPSVKIYYPTSLQDLIQICSALARRRAFESGWKPLGSLHGGSQRHRIHRNQRSAENAFAGMDSTLYDVVPARLDPKFLQALKQRHPS